MITVPFAQALEWWLRSQGKWNGGVSTGEGRVELSPNMFVGDGSFVITKWDVPDVPEPDEKQILKILDDYNAYASSKETAKEVSVSTLKTKLVALGLSQDEIDLLTKGKS